jgi:GR25 family glycosyltransferase involved in LPS biosynthesis
MTDKLYDIILIINLKNNKDRKKFMIEQLEKLKITNYKFIDAIDGRKLNKYGKLFSYSDTNNVNKYNNNLNKYNNDLIKKRIINKDVGDKYIDNTKKYRLLTPGEVGCYLSHIKCYKYIIKKKYNRALILEDDALFSTNYNKMIEKLEFRPNCKLLYFGLLQYKQNEYKLYKASDNLYKLYAYTITDYGLLPVVYGKYAYIIDSAGCQQFLKNIALPMRYPLDIELSLYFSNNLYYSNVIDQNILFDSTIQNPKYRQGPRFDPSNIK